MATLGFVGLGAMGSRLARRLLAAGHTVVGYNRTPEKARDLVTAGLRLEKTPGAVAASTEAVFSMVTDDAALRAVALAPDGIVGALGPGTTYVEMSTVSPALPRETAVEALLKSVIASPMVKYRGPFVIGKMPTDAWFPVPMIQKDLQLALEQGRAVGVPLPTTALVQEWLTMARGLGLGHFDFGILFDVLASLSGAPASKKPDRR